MEPNPIEPDTVSWRKRLELRVDWSGVDDVEPRPANFFAATVGVPDVEGKPDGIYLAVGHLVPPLLIRGSDEEVDEQLARMQGRRGVQVGGHFLMTRARLDELIGVLRTAAAQYDDIMVKLEGGPDAD